MPEATLTATAPSASVAGEGAGTGSVVESPSTTEEQPLGAPLDTGAETALPEAEIESGAPSEQTDSPTDGEGDQRTLPNAIKALKESSPEAFKAAKGLFFENRAFKSEFPSVAAARQAKQVLEIAGGEAGIAQMQEDMGEFKEVALQFMNGDPAFISDLAETDPVAFATHVPVMLDKLREVDGPLYNREMAKRIHGEHAAIGLRPAIENVYGLIQSGKKDEALAVLEKMAGWHDKIEGLSKQEDDPRYRKLQDELKKSRESESTREDERFFTGYRKDASEAINTAADKLLTSYLKDAKLDDDLKLELRNEAIALANKNLEANETFKKQRDLLFGRRDTQASVRYAVSSFQQALGSAIQEVIRKQSRIVRAFGKQASLGTAKTPAVAAKTNGVPAGWTKVARPDPSKIDRDRTPAGMILNEKRAVYKDGSKVTWAT